MDKAIKFNRGDVVSWVSQAGGHYTTKKGTVVAVVRPGHDPNVLVPTGLRPIKTFGKPREVWSYLIQVGASKEVYWPVTGNLKIVTKAVKAPVFKIPPPPPERVFTGLDKIKLIDNAKFGKWISCAKGFPLVKLLDGYWETKPVIVFQGGKYNPICTARFTLRGNDKECGGTDIFPCFRTDDGIKMGRVTHWMPLPPEPDDAVAPPEIIKASVSAAVSEDIDEDIDDEANDKDLTEVFKEVPETEDSEVVV